jgi:3D (Asp-Asp-Asp) domain-containing protein
VEGTGASGKWSHPGTVAADRNILPLNSRIRIFGAGKYSGDYTVEDTGGKVDGHHIDVYMPSRAEAKKFGRQRVKVVILHFGDDEASAPDPEQKAHAKAAKVISGVNVCQCETRSSCALQTGGCAECKFGTIASTGTSR